MTAGRGLAGGALAAAVTALIVGLSRVPYTAAPSNDGELRLAWRSVGERVEECRRRSAEELAKLPVHMRNPVACERRLRPYLLTAVVDGRPLVDDTVRARGAEADRPLSVFRRLPMAPGRHQVRVAFSPLPLAADSLPAREQAVEASLVVAPRQVVLVTLDAGRGVLVVRTR